MQAIESVLAQTFSDFELIVVDDGSIDETRTMVEELRDPRIRYVYQSNNGRSVARNNGLRIAEGQYIAFLDDDDLFLPDKLEIQTAVLMEHSDTGFVGSGFIYTNADASPLFTNRPWEAGKDLSLESFVFRYSVLALSSTLFRRNILLALSECFDPSFHLFEDTDMYLRLFLSGATFEWHPAVVSLYRLHPFGTAAQTAPNILASAARRMVDKLFSQPEAPFQLRERRSELYAFYDLVVACRAYSSRQLPVAQELLEKALFEVPVWEETLFPDFIAWSTGLPQGDPRSYINFVFDNLPPSLSHLGKYRKECFRRFLQRVAKAGSYGEGPLRKESSSSISK